MAQCDCGYPEGTLYSDMPTVEYYNPTDNFYCEVCDIWMDEVCSCGSKNCEFSGHRETKPSLAYLKRFSIEGFTEHVSKKINKLPVTLSLSDITAYINFLWTVQFANDDTHSYTTANRIEFIREELIEWIFLNPRHMLHMYEIFLPLINDDNEARKDFWKSHIQSKITAIKTTHSL